MNGVEGERWGASFMDQRAWTLWLILVAPRPPLPLPGTAVSQGVEAARRVAFSKAQHYRMHCFAKGRRIVKGLISSLGLGVRDQDSIDRPRAIRGLGKSATFPGLCFLFFFLFLVCVFCVFSNVGLMVFWFVSSFLILMKEMNSLFCVWFSWSLCNPSQTPD